MQGYIYEKNIYQMLSIHLEDKTTFINKQGFLSRLV